MDTGQDQYEIIAKTFHGLEGVLAEEIKLLGGATDIKILNRAVSYKGDNKILYQSNYFLHTALAILKPIYSFKARNDNDLYTAIYDYPWENVLSPTDSLSLTHTVKSRFFKHSKYIIYRVKDAIVDRLKKSKGIRPVIDVQDPKIKINIHLMDEHVKVSLDSSGIPLYKRGYRIDQGPASLNEVLAAGMIKLSGWDFSTDFIDPMCGSGTLPIEAALLAYKIPPGRYRRKFGFQNWIDYDQALFKKSVKSGAQTNSFNHHIIGSDKSPDAVSIAKKNLQNASLNHKVEINQKDFDDLTPVSNNAIVMINPPYGKRLYESNINDLYHKIGRKIKFGFVNHTIWILSNHKEAMKYIGLKPFKKILLYNGSLECKFYGYSIYQGSKKIN